MRSAQAVQQLVGDMNSAALQGTSARLLSPPGSLALQTETRCASPNLGGAIVSIRGVVQGQQVAVVVVAKNDAAQGDAQRLSPLGFPALQRTAPGTPTDGIRVRQTASDVLPVPGQRRAAEVLHVEGGSLMVSAPAQGADELPLLEAEAPHGEATRGVSHAVDEARSLE